VVKKIGVFAVKLALGIDLLDYRLKFCLISAQRPAI